MESSFHFPHTATSAGHRVFELRMQVLQRQRTTDTLERTVDALVSTMFG